MIERWVNDIGLKFRCAILLVAFLSPTTALPAVLYEQRGYIEGELRAFPQLTEHDGAYVVGSALLRWEPTVKFGHGLTLFLGVDAQTDSHRQVERDLDYSWWDRTSRRSLISPRRASLLFRKKSFSFEVGKQFIRWGKTDILNPTDRFAPKDYLTPVATEYLPVTAARLNLTQGANNFEVVYAPVFTPARIPLLNQRWAPSAGIPSLELRDAGASFPGGPQAGIRWSRIDKKLEYSFCFYQGFHYLPLFAGTLDLATQSVLVRRSYPNLRAFGGDAAIPLRWFTVKTEAEGLTSSTPGQDKYVLFVVQLERQWKDWLFVAGYSGNVVTERRGGLQYSADRGYTRAFVARASVNLAHSRSLLFETVVRQNGNGMYAKAEYSQAFGQHWRLSANFVGLRGDPSDFLGQYRRNSYGSLIARYSF